METFDAEQRELLQPLRELNGVVFFPFFANTFPLAFHYYAINGSVSLHDWSKPIPSEILKGLMGDDPFVFFATKKTLTDRYNELHQSVFLGTRFISEYLPRLFFFHTHKHLFLNSIIAQTAQDRRINPDFLNSLAEHYDTLEIYTDIPEQAQLLRKHFSRAFKKVRHNVSVISGWKQWFTYPTAEKRVVRVYFYGAPVTAALEKRTTEFTSMQFPAIASKEKDDLQTYICAGYLKMHNVNSERFLRSKSDLLKTILDNLHEYYRRLYNAAANEYSGDLREVWWTYNRYALSRQHNSLFESPRDFARSLSLHHSGSPPPPRKVQFDCD